MPRTGLSLTLALIGLFSYGILAAAQSQPAAASPVAYIYVSAAPSTSTFQIHGYAAASNGKLTPIPGSPFGTNDQFMALNGRWLFASNGTDIDSYSIASDGALKLSDTYNAGIKGGGPGDLFLDHTGASLYVGYINLGGTGNEGYQAYSIDQANGKITFINQVVGGPSIGSILSFIGNNVYAYSSGCYEFDPLIYGFKRQSDGAVTELNIQPPLPTAQSGKYYCSEFAAADPTNHLAIAVQPYSGFNVAGPFQLATYSANTSGDLSTNSTYTNMPTVAVGDVTDYWMAPSGKLLAVGGTKGLQIFHFNGANPITHYTNLLTTNEVDQMFWDNVNHLYAISKSAGKLYVFTVTPTSMSQAPGSPYSIAHPENIIVLPRI